MGPFGFEIPLEARRPKVKVKNLEGPIHMPFMYVKHCPFFFQSRRFYGIFLSSCFHYQISSHGPHHSVGSGKYNASVLSKMDCTTFAKVDPTMEIIILNLEATELILVCSFCFVHHFSISNFFVLSV